MAENLDKRPSKRGPISKIRPSDGCGRDTVPLAVDQRYDFHEFGCHLGNVAKVYFGADSGVANRLVLQQMHQNRHPYQLRRKFISRKFLG
jgi:hypothetical protein